MERLLYVLMTILSLPFQLTCCDQFQRRVDVDDDDDFDI
jgi:hypothetical protein